MFLESGSKIHQSSFIETCLYCLDQNQAAKIPPRILELCDAHLTQKQLTIQNKVKLCELYSSTKSPFFWETLSALAQLTPTQLLTKSDSPTEGKHHQQYFGKFGFEQIASLA